MKKFNAIIYCLLTIALLSSCDSSKKLEQANAENTIKEFVQTNYFGGGGSWGQQGSFDVNSISSFEPIFQFNEIEASSVVHFNYHDAFADGNLSLKFNFKRNIDKKWVLTSVDAISGVGSQGMSDKINNWQNINILVQKGIKSNENKASLMANIRYLLQKKVKDADGNIYHTVKIGTQVWMVENLKTTKYNDGSSIPYIKSWSNNNIPGYCWYNNDVINKNNYGALYNWLAVNTDKLAPKGWHVPTAEEWATLISFLGGKAAAFSKIKETGTTHWGNPNSDATNETGFTALPAGICNEGSFYYLGSFSYLWNSSDAGRGIGMSSSYGGVIPASGHKSAAGFSVRCIKE
jgi:uncharacterized protein (TIGR02145 family)